MRAVYLDNNATTRPDPEVVAAMLTCLTEDFGNPSSVHDFGSLSRIALKQAREKVRALLGAAFREEILFTSGGTEADNTAILGALDAADGRNEIIVSAVEHPAVLALCSHLERTRRIKVHRIPVDALGRLDRGRYRAALSHKVALVSIMWANNETGVVFPVEELAKEAKAVGALFHTDAVQAVGRLPIALRETAIDMLSLSAHKLHGPKGVGALYVRRDVPFRSLILGGNQERGRRGGTENTPGIVGLGKAAEMATSRLRGDAARMRALRDRLEASLMARIPNAFVLGDVERRLPNTSAIVCEGAEADAIVLLLNRAGVAASSGAACAAGSTAPSHVLRAMAVPAALAAGAVRLSLSRDNDDDDIDRVIATMPAIVDRLRVRSLGPECALVPRGVERAYA
jgi:cysteine desulfurase